VSAPDLQQTGLDNFGFIKIRIVSLQGDFDGCISHRSEFHAVADVIWVQRLQENVGP
jgi:hypothetical protein